MLLACDVCTLQAKFEEKIEKLKNSSQIFELAFDRNVRSLPSSLFPWIDNFVNTQGCIWPPTSEDIPKIVTTQNLKFLKYMYINFVKQNVYLIIYSAEYKSWPILKPSLLIYWQVAQDFENMHKICESEGRSLTAFI